MSRVPETIVLFLFGIMFIFLFKEQMINLVEDMLSIVEKIFINIINLV